MTGHRLPRLGQTNPLGTTTYRLLFPLHSAIPQPHSVWATGNEYMGILGNLFTGSALTNLTSVFEEIERTRQTHFIGAGGGFDSLPKRRQLELERKVPKWLATLQQRPAHEVTNKLLKNMQVAAKFGRQERMQAQSKLLDWLVQKNVAIDPEEFLASHGVNVEIPLSRVVEPPQPASAPAADPEGSDFAITPAMPDITRSKPVSGFMVGTQFLMFYEAPQPVAKRHAGISLPLTYLYAASVFDSTTRKMVRLFTLETGFTDDIFLCMFDRTGAHANLGEGAPLANLPTFEAAVVNLVCKTTGTLPQAARRVAI